MSKEQRAIIEDDLKRGRLPCVVATSSLELGIDMGAVDLVIQIESPPSVASALQRVGRAGHQVGEVSRGVLFPKHRGDLAQTAVAVERMRSGAIEKLSSPPTRSTSWPSRSWPHSRMEEWEVDELFDLVTPRGPYSELPRSAFDATLDLLSGRYPSEEFAELRPRIVWDRVTGCSPGARVPSGSPSRAAAPSPTAGCSASSSSARRRAGWASSTRRWSTSPGWATSSRSAPPAGGSRTSPTTGCWSRRRPASPAGCRSGRATRSAAPPSWARPSARSPASWPPAPAKAIDSVRERGLDDNAATNLVTYVAEQREATKVVPSDTQIVVERFRDELGDWRLVVHSPYGTPVHAPWALAINARLRERYDIDGQAVASDDGIVIRIPDTEDEPPAGEIVVFEPDEIEQLVTQEVGGSALFASRFRECAARPCCSPAATRAAAAPCGSSASAAPSCSRSPHSTRPSRSSSRRSASASRTSTTCPLSSRCSARAASRGHRRRRRHHPPSPYARSLLFGYVAQFVYEGDSPIAERRAAALSLDQGLLAELLGRAELRELLDPEVLAEVEAELQWLAPDRRARNAEAVADLLRLLGPLSPRRSARSVDGADVEGWLASLDVRRVVPVRMAGEERWTTVEDVGRLRDGLGVPVPLGTPDAFTEPPEDPIGDLVSRYARTHGPFTTAEVAARLGLGEAVARQALQRLAPRGRLLEGEFRPSGSGTEWCDAEVLRKLRRRSLARLRKEVEPVTHDTVARFLPAWQRVGGNLRGVDGVVAAIDQLAGCPVPASALEPLVLAAAGARLRAGHARRADRLRRGHLGRPRPAARQRRLGQPAPRRPGPPHAARRRGRRADALQRAVLEALDPGGAWFFRQLPTGSARRPTPTSQRPVGTGLEGPGHQRHPHAAAGAGALRHRDPPHPRAPPRLGRRPAAGCPSAPDPRRRPVGGRCSPSATATRPGVPTPAPSTCSSVTAWSPAAR